MQEKDLKERIYQYYDLIRKEINLTGVKKSETKTKVTKAAKPASKTIKWRSKGY